MAATTFDWQAAIKHKRQTIAEKTPRDWVIPQDILQNIRNSAQEPGNSNLLKLGVFQRTNTLTDKELAVTEHFTARQLLAKLQTGELTAVEVTTAFCKRAVVASQLLSCVTEVLYNEALQRAAQLDEHYQKTGAVIGPLHGLPISVKDSFSIKGLQTTVGYAALLADPPADENSCLINMLLDAGAVLYVKTNVPQTMMTADSDNNIYGRTLNPRNINLTSGGSSGGEGSLVSFRGSVLGVGTDIAGSIRIPSLCCGIYGFKPTADRVPYGGQKSGHMEGLPGLTPSAGPLAHNLDDIDLFLSTILSSATDTYDSTALAVPWKQLKMSSKLRIGVLGEEKVFPLHPPIRRTIANAINALSKAGHEIIPLPTQESCSISFANRLAFQYYLLEPDPSHKFFPPDGEPRVTSVAARYNPLFSGPFLVSNDLDPIHKINALGELRKAYAESWRQYWVSHNIDVLICPAAQNTAVPHDTYGWPPYTQIWNLLDYPACVIPYGHVDKVLDPQLDSNDDFGPQPQYNAEALDGAPCSLQVVTRRLHDEECLAAAKIIDTVLNGVS